LGFIDEVQTPSLDRLSQNGMVFTHAYNMGAWQPAVCIASRTMLNTGRFIWDAYRYDTYMTGKWHLEIPAASVFDHVEHERPGMPDDAWSSDLMKEMERVYKKGGDVSHLMANG
jgi:arylsulfatase A-like enzyme